MYVRFIYTICYFMWKFIMQCPCQECIWKWRPTEANTQRSYHAICYKPFDEIYHYQCEYIKRTYRRTYLFRFISILSERMMQGRFLSNKGTRLNANFVGIDGIRSVPECGTTCNKVHGCLGFNFNRGPPVVCEICYVPHDAPGANMTTDFAWNHYAIVP